MKLLPAILLGMAVAAYLLYSRDTYQALKGLHGPAQVTITPTEPPDPRVTWQNHTTGEPSRLAVFLTDTASPWGGIQQALESIGVPYIFTDNVEQAAKHRVMLVYPMISGKYVKREQQEHLKKFVSDGGFLLATQVLGTDLKDLFGYENVEETRDHWEVRFTDGQDLTSWLTHERERVLRLSNPLRPATWGGTQHYTGASQVLATYQNGKAAWIGKDHPGGGKAMALGFDLGFHILKCQNDRDEEASRTYVNDYEPSIDVWLRLLRHIYQKYEPLPVTVGTVPDGRPVSAVVSFDIDYVKSMDLMTAYGDLLMKYQIPATFFVQAKYYRDYFDTGFFNDESVALLQKLDHNGIEMASHSVAHSDMFNRLPLGTGSETYPTYQPRVKNRGDTQNASVLGEMRVSKYLLETLLNTQVRSFRPGYLSCPPALPQALEATGYRYSSSVTGASVMTYLPYKKAFDRKYAGMTGIYEFPVAVEDEHPPEMDQRVDSALALADRLATYGGSFVILSHPNVLDHKYRFFEKILPPLKEKAWIGTLAQFGDWWSARGQIQIDAAERGQEIQVRITAPVPIQGITFQIPSHWQPSGPLPQESTLENGRLFFPKLTGTASAAFKRN